MTNFKQDSELRDGFEAPNETLSVLLVGAGRLSAAETKLIAISSNQ